MSFLLCPEDLRTQDADRGLVYVLHLAAAACGRILYLVMYIYISEFWCIGKCEC